MVFWTWNIGASFHIKTISMGFDTRNGNGWRNVNKVSSAFPISFFSNWIFYIFGLLCFTVDFKETSNMEKTNVYSYCRSSHSMCRTVFGYIKCYFSYDTAVQWSKSNYSGLEKCRMGRRIFTTGNGRDRINSANEGLGKSASGYFL